MNDRSLNEYLAYCRLKGQRPTTIAHKARVLPLIAKAIDKPLLTATPDDLYLWQQTHQHLSFATQRTYLAHLRDFYRWAIEYEKLDIDPAAKLIKPRQPRRLPRPIAEDDLDLAIKAADPMMRCWLILAAWCGLRCCEIAGLALEDVLIKDRILIIREGKGGKERTVPFGAGVLAELGPWLRRAPRGPLFRREDGRPVTAAFVSARSSAFLRSLGITDTLHSLRHRYGTMLYRESLDLRMVAALMGHESAQTTVGYVAFHPGRAAEAVNRLDAALYTTKGPRPTSR